MEFVLELKEQQHNKTSIKAAPDVLMRYQHQLEENAVYYMMHQFLDTGSQASLCGLYAFPERPEVLSFTLEVVEI